MSNRQLIVQKVVLLGTFFFILFYIFSILVSRDVLFQFDFDTTVKLQDRIPTRIDGFFSFLSILGSFEVTTTILFILIAIQLIVHGAFRKMSIKQFFLSWRSIWIIPLFALAHIVEILGKTFLEHPNPPHMFHRYSLDFIFPSTYVQPGNAYPSGHSMRTIFLVIMVVVLIMLAKKLHRVTKMILYGSLSVLTVLVLISRVSLGEHWTTDVIGGALLGAAFACICIPFLITYKDN